MTPEATSKTEEARIQELRLVLNTHESEAAKALSAGMFHTVIHETKECIRLAKDVATIRSL